MNLWFNLKHTLRLLARNIKFSALCMFVISMGIGVTLTLYKMADNLYFKVPPFVNGGQYVVLLGEYKPLGIFYRDYVDTYVYRAIRARSESYEVLGAVQTNQRATLSDGDTSQSFESALVTPNIFNSIGISPILGRVLEKSDASQESAPVVLVSHKVWQTYYAGRTDIVGLRTRINGSSHTIIGVMPEGFNFPFSQDLLFPMRVSTADQPGENRITPIAVLKNGVSASRAQAELNMITEQFREQHPDEYSNWGGKVMPYVGIYESNGRQNRFAIVGMGLVILFLVCLNVGNLLLLRANERVQELVTRKALGASNWSIVQQGLMEPFLICLGGLVIGLILAFFGLKASGQAFLELFQGSSLPFWMDFSLDIKTIIVTIVAALAFSLLMGVGSAVHLSSLNYTSVLSGGNKGAIKGNKKISGAIVSIEIVLSVSLLISGCMFYLAIRFAEGIDYGTASDNYITASINMIGTQYEDSDRRYQYLEDLLAEVDSEVGIDSSALTSALPSQNIAPSLPYGIEDRDLKIMGNNPTQFVNSVTTNYFETMEVPILAGRSFGPEDISTSLPVAIIDDIFSKQIWGEESPLGKRIQLNPENPQESEWLTVVGVIPHIIQDQPFAGLDRTTTIYRPLSQFVPRNLLMAAKVKGDPSDYQRKLMLAATRVDREVALTRIQSLNRVLDLATLGTKIVSLQILAVAVVSLVLAIVGIYGLISRSISLRTQEVGIRRALGSPDGIIYAIFFKQASKYLGAGVVIGGGLGLVSAYITLSGLFPQILDFAFVVFLGVSILMTVLVCCATYIPSHKLVAIRLADSLRYE